MSVIPIFASSQPFYVPAYEVKLVSAGGAAGQPIPGDVLRDVIEVTFENSIERVDSFSLSLNNWNADTREPSFLGSPTADWLKFVQPGNNVQLSMGYQGRSPDMRVMTIGPITSLVADFPESGAPRMSVTGNSILENGRKKQYTWKWPQTGAGTTESQVAKDLGASVADSPPGRPGLGVEVRVNDQAAAREQQVDSIMMNNEYPIVFLAQLAKRNGYDVVLTQDPSTGSPYVYFGPSQLVSDTTYELDWGKSLVSFKPTISVSKQVNKVTVNGWDRKSKQPIRGVATTDQMTINTDLWAFVEAMGHEEVVANAPVDNQAQADRKAADYLNAQLQEMVTATGVTVGLPDLRAGRSVQIQGVDPLLDGRWFLTSTTHTINDSGYRTTFNARRESLGGS